MVCFFLQNVSRLQDARHQFVRRRRIAGNRNVDVNDLIDPTGPKDGVAVLEQPARTRAVPGGDNRFGFGHGDVRLQQSLAHVQRDGTETKRTSAWRGEATKWMPTREW